MRITRIRLKDYRGIEEREVELAPLGVTVVQGPNEIGKSSIAEGLNLLLEHLDSSGRKEIKEVKPVGRDVGPEVEVDMASVRGGPIPIDPMTLGRLIRSDSLYAALSGSVRTTDSPLLEHPRIPAGTSL